VQRALAALPPGSWVLDAACGTGLDLAALVRRGHHVVGADASPAMLQEARRRVDADLACCTWAELPDHVRGPFAAVLCVGNSLPHLPTSAARRGALAAFASLLAPGGLLIVDSHDWEAVHAAGSGARDDPQVLRRGGEVGHRRFEWRVPERFGDPYVLTVTLTVDDRTTAHEVVSHPFTRDQLLDEVTSSGLIVEDVVTVPGDDRYAVLARRRTT
jgi:SAM-dependent methyltransferase